MDRPARAVAATADGAATNTISGNSSSEWEEQFYGIIRDNIISMLVLLFLCIVAFAVLRHFRRTRNGPGSLLATEARLGVPFFICVVCLAAVFASLLLLPTTTLANEVAIRFAESVWFRWLDANLLETVWWHAYYLNNTALFILLPFAYFYHETEDVLQQWYSKLIETIKTLTLVDILMYGFTKLMQFILGLDQSHGFAALNAMACVIGALLILQTLPNGFMVLFHLTQHLSVEAIEELENEEMRLNLEIMTAQRRLALARAREPMLRNYRRRSWSDAPNSMYSPTIELRPRGSSGNGAQLSWALASSRNGILPSSPASNPQAAAPMTLVTPTYPVSPIDSPRRRVLRDEEEPSNEVRDTNREIERLGVKLANVQRRQRLALRTPIVRKAIWLLVVLCIAALWLTLMIVLLINLTRGIASVVASSGWNATPLLGRAVPTTTGLLRSFVEVLLFVYVFVAAVAGLYSLPKLQWLRPRAHRTPMLELISNLYLMLLLGTALPFVVSICRLASFDAMGPLQGVYFFTGRQFLAIMFQVILLGRSLWPVFSVTVRYFETKV